MTHDTPSQTEASPSASAATTAEPAVALSGVRKEYGPVVALEGIDCAFRTGSVHCLAGPNGSGKTTLLRLIAGLTRPTAGTIERSTGTLGYAFQRPNVYPDLSVAENLDVFAELTGADPDWRAELVDRLRLSPVTHRRAGDLSDGFQKKLDLALALLKRPDVVLCDEPLADLDDVTRERLLALLEDYRAEAALVVSTHNLDAFAPLTDRVTVLLDGAVVERADEASMPPGGPAAVYESALDRVSRPE